MKKFDVDLTTSEIELQSLTQLSLQLFVVFQRADRFPTFLQWLQIGSSFVTTAKGKADEFITFISGADEDDGFLNKLKNLGMYLITPTLPIWAIYWLDPMLKRKQFRIRETLNLSTCADCSSNTKFKKI